MNECSTINNRSVIIRVIVVRKYFIKMYPDFRIACFLTVVLLLILTHTSLGLKCWHCRSDIDPKCADPFDNTTFVIQDCDHKRLAFLPDARAHLCRKIRQKVHGEWRYVRSCAFLGEPGISGDERFCLLRTGTYNIFMEYCTCNSKDGCNSSNSLYKSKFLVFLSLIIPYIIYKLVR